MTPSETNTLDRSASHLIVKKMGSDTVTRKASFKCPTPNKAVSQRITRKVVLPMSTVQALTFKFNELSQKDQMQKHKISQAAVKNMLGVNGKQSTIKVVICRKPSTKQKRLDEVLVRKRINIRKFQPADSNIFKENNNVQKNVHQKISEFEEMKKVETDSKFVSSRHKNRTTKMQVPKILVDIDLDADNCVANHKEGNCVSDDKHPSEIICSENYLTVRKAINLFEKSSSATVLQEKNFHKQTKPEDRIAKKEDSNMDANKDVRMEFSQEIKAKPVAAIKPILKKVEDVRKTKLSPKDSLNRKKYIAMKRELAKEKKDIDASDEDSSFSLGEKIEDSADLKGNENKEIKVSQNTISVTCQENEKRLKNNSSLHKQISSLHSNFTVITNEIPLNEKHFSFEAKATSETGNANQNLKPNTSFLWSKKEEIYGDKQSKGRLDLPLPVPPEDFVPDVIDSTQTIYDDVRPMSQDSDSEDFEKVSDSEEETYDDVGVYCKNKKDGYQNQTCNKTENLRDEVREKNLRNEMSNLQVSDSLYDCPEKYLYSYDDGEGERYQYISDRNVYKKSISKQSEYELYQYIQTSKDDNNIYEDIQSIKCHLTTKDRTKDFYEDINCVVNSVTDNSSINNCYETVYNGIYSSNNPAQAYIKSDVSDTSNNSGRSTYEKSNSLYGMSTGNLLENEHCLSTPDQRDSLEDSCYHLTSNGSACPNSETSQSNSDEWIEVSDSESEGTVYLVHERPKKTRNGGNTWSQKEKRRWKKLQKKSNFSTEEAKSLNSEDHFYESVGQYESNTESLFVKNPDAVHGDQSNSVNNEQPCNEEQYIDDFDSQSSEDEAYGDAKLPDIPNHGYNITRSLKAAGKRLKKNLSLRKSDLSKSLKRFKKSSRPKVNETVFVNTKEVARDSISKVETPLVSVNFNSSTYSNNSDSSSSSHNITKSNTTGDLKSQKHRKSWTFRNRFKSGSSLDSAENAQSVDTNRNSTFYLPLNEVQPKKIEKKDELLNEIQSVLSQRNSNSAENVPEKIDKDVSLRHSDSGSALSKSRPSIPPPPPPALNKVEMIAEKTKYSDILWGEKATNNSLYVESGLFDKQKKHSRCMDSDTSLYAEIGLYGASEDFTCRKTQMFVDEPLYQFYTESVNQRARDDILNNYDSEGYEEINDYYSVINEKRRTIDIKNVRPNFEDFNDDVHPKVTSFRSILDRRTLWCQIPAVIDSCILNTLSDQARKLQEAKFEILTSEGSYMNSLNILESHFMKKVSDLNMIAKRDLRILFSNIVSVKKCSESFLVDLENCWQNNIMLNGICDIVYKHATTSFHVYTKYCKNQVCIYRTLRELLDKNSNFESALKEIESDPICQNLNIHSFLMLPMQRITRLPLLMGAVLARLDKTDDEYEICKASFDVLNKIVQDCDDEARRMEKCEEMLILSQQIEFPKDIRRIPIITGSRFLVKSGQVTQLVNRDENKLTFGKKFSKVSLTLFLFTDLLILAKKKNIRNYVVVDHCPRNLVQMQTTDGLTQLPVKLNTNTDMSGKLLMLLTMLENHEKKTVEMILSFEMESDRQRWLDAVTPKLSENPNECIYEEWDCPQVIALYEFTPTQPDELNLCIGDVVNVLKKMNDGWYQGERLRDGARGWFPQNHTQEISSSHVRAKNKKLRYKLLALSGNFIDSQKIIGK